MNILRRHSIGLIILGCALLIGACSEPTKPAGPKFSGRVLLLNGDPTKGANLAELSASGDGYNLSPLTTGVFEAAANPDQTQLLYTTTDEIMLRDLRSGAIKSLIKADGRCLAWAPDGNHFSYQQRSSSITKFFESDLEGKAKLLLDDPNGSTDCARWISPDRLVFDRFVGALQKKSAGSEPLKPNTTTIATIGEPVKLKDTPKKWTIEGICAKANNGFVRSATGALLIAKNIDHFETLDPASASCSECRFVGYAAQSCVPFFIEQPTSVTTELFYLNPTNWQKQKPASISHTFSPNAKMLIKSSARLMVVGDAPWTLILIDTETGDVTPFFQRSAAEAIPIKSPVPIVWIEN